MHKLLAVLPLLLALPLAASAQVTSDSQALALAKASMTALTGGQQISDVTLTGVGAESAGGYSANGSATLKAKGYFQSRYDNQVSRRYEIRTLDSDGMAEGQWMDVGGGVHSLALHNCWINASWFFPALSFLAATSRPDVVASYVGQETRNGTAVQHLRFQRVVNNQTPSQITLIAQLSTLDVYLDAASLLPVAMTYQGHPDSDYSTSIPIEIDFSSYQSVNGLQVPFHIQKFLRGQPALDFQTNNIAVNTGLTDSDFAILQ